MVEKRFNMKIDELFLIKIVASIALLTISISVESQNMKWIGKYDGDIQGTKAVLDVTDENQQLSGMIDASGYRYHLQGSISGSSSNGRLIDVQTQGQLEYQAILQDDSILLTLSTWDPLSGRSNSFQVNFAKAGNSKDGVVGSIQDDSTKHSEEQTERDQNIVGAWIYSESYNSGGFGFASQWKMQINPDGSYLYGDARIMGGDGGSSIDSGGGDVTRGQWRTQNGVIHINEGYSWQPYARYHVEGYSMMLTFGDGSRQVWKRM